MKIILMSILFFLFLIIYNKITIIHNGNYFYKTIHKIIKYSKMRKQTNILKS